MTHDPRVYGYVDGKPCYSADEFVFTKRGFGPIEDDEELIKYAAKVSGNWYSAGWRRSFIDFYLGDYALDHPKCDLTSKEYERLKELQKIAQEEYKKKEAEKEWKLIGTYGYADNSVEEVWESKDGERKTVMTVWPHGDIC